MSKPPEILALEKAYGITLTETKDHENINNSGQKNLYFLNKNEQVIGLNLVKNNITKIENLEYLANLTQLNISFNQISKIENLNHLKPLQELHISGNKIEKIENLENLINLTQLNISENQISKIENLNHLKLLQELRISSNEIKKIENLDKLTNLQELYISHNQISEIKNLEQLTNLQLLDVSHNQISKIENLNNLKILNISQNRILGLLELKEVFSNSKLERINIANNSFVEDQNLILKENENHLDIIKSELQKLTEEQISLKFPVKVMLLGNHLSGKSTLLNYLQTQKCSKVDKSKNSSTHVLSVEHSKETINHDLPKAIYYDFGGQDYYHGVYQAFFTQEAVNLLVWNPKSNHNTLLEKDTNTFSTQNYNRAYWLSQLEYAFEKRYGNSNDNNDPLLLVQTHADEYLVKDNWKETFQTHRIVEEFQISLNIDFESIKNDAALAYLTATFWDVVDNQSSEEKEVPEWYPGFLKYILSEGTSKAVPLTTIMQQFKRKDYSKKKLVFLGEKTKLFYLKVDLEQLARKGLLLYYKNDEELNDVAWLNPSATVTEIHKTILDKGTIKTKGRISKESFKKREIDPKIERLLINEKVLFFDEANNEYIIPNYLPLTSEDDEIYDLLKFDFNKPTFVLKFERFIPFGLINQLICHYGQNPDKKHYWRDQLIFTLNKQFKVWIQLDFSKLTISVSIKPKQAKDPKLNEVTQQIFKEILYLYWSKPLIKIDEELVNEDLGNVTPEDKLEGKIIARKYYKDIFKNTLKPDDLYFSTDGKYFVHYNTLDNPKKTHESIVSYELPEDENKNDLDKSTPRTQRSYKYRNFTDNENIKKMKKIFISYSREDVDYKNELRKHLNMLKRFDVADNWSCEDITIGKWHDQIQKELEESDLVIFMLSINFFNSKYILEQEVQKTMDKIANGSDKKVYSIIVSDFPGLENFDTEDLDESQRSILKLGDYQYGMYAQEKSVVTGNTKERIISLKEASNRGIIDTQLTKIVTKIMKEIK